jgi:predicted esterase
MSTPTLPDFGASLNNVITAGHSSGAETSAHLLIAFPEIFGCAGVLNGAMPLTLQWTQD